MMDYASEPSSSLYETYNVNLR